MTESYQKWIEAGYKAFASEGPEGIIVEKLAKNLGYNKSGFYHYFGDKEIFLGKIIEYHSELSDQFALKVAKCRNFDPDYLNLIVNSKIEFMVQMQLRKNIHIPLYYQGFKTMEKRNEFARNSIWSEYLGISDRPDLSLKMWEFMRDTIFMRFDPKKHNIESLREITSELKAVVKDLRKSDSF